MLEAGEEGLLLAGVDEAWLLEAGGLELLNPAEKLATLDANEETLLLMAMDEA